MVTLESQAISVTHLPSYWNNKNVSSGKLGVSAFRFLFTYFIIKHQPRHTLQSMTALKQSDRRRKGIGLYYRMLIFCNKMNSQI